MNPLRWLLTAPVWQALRSRYVTARERGASRFASGLNLFWCALGWALLQSLVDDLEWTSTAPENLRSAA